MRGQLSLFDTTSDQLTEKCAVQWVLYVDGASRGNPGPAGAGIYITRDDGVFVKQGYFLGTATNNQAEYMALVLGICQVKPYVEIGHSLRIISDSELLVRQISGIYQVKHNALKFLHARAVEYLSDMHYTITHVMRSENTIADALANEGIDKRREIPDALRALCVLPVVP